MLLTIHNLPLTTRYPDVKSLLHEKCGLTDIIVDNLVNEGKSKKVTVGLSNEDDGAFVVRKLNGLFINGQQLYIEHKRRNTTVHEQPYRPPSSFMQESRGFEQTHINNMMETAMAPNAPSWNQKVTAPYVAHMPAEQNVAYSGYGGVPQTPHYIEPRPVPAEKEREYSGFQGDNYIPTVASSGPVHQAPGDWGRNGREQPSETFSHYNRKRRHSPERPAAPRLSRKDRHDAARAEPPRQWSEQGPSNPGPRPPFHQPEQFPRNQHQNVDDRYEPREPSPDYRHTDPQWETKRWDEPKVNPRSEREREWGNDNHNDWVTKPVRVWENPPEQQWQGEPRRWDNEPEPQWEDNYSSMPEENNGPEWYEGLQPGPSHGNNDQEFHPQDQGQYRESRSRKSRFDDRSSDPIWDKEPSKRSVSRPTASSNRQGRPAEEMQRRDRPRSKNGRQEREWRGDRPNASWDRPKKPVFEKQVPKNYPESTRQRPAREFNRRVVPKAIARPTLSRQERDEKYNKKVFVKEEKNYPPRKPEHKLLSLRALINKDTANRAEAASIIAKTVIGLPKACSTDAVNKSVGRFTFRQLKKCIKSRIDVELGEELSQDTSDAVKKYRAKYPINQDKTFLEQIREKAEIERQEINAKIMLKKAGLEGERVKTEAEIKKEEDETENNSQREDVLNQARLEVENETKEHKETMDSNTKGTETKKPSLVPLIPLNMPKGKPGQPLTDKQVTRQMKLQRKLEYNQDGLYSLDEVSNKVLGDELAELEKLFTEECSQPDDQHDEAICKRITTVSLNEFHKTIRLYISKRILNIPTGLLIRVFAQGKLPRKTAIKEYLQKYRIESMTFKKNVKGTMFIISLSRFEDFDHLCRIEHDAIDGIPVTFKAMNLVGPPTKINKNQVKKIRERLIQGQIDPNINLAEFEDTTDYGAVGAVDKEDFEDFEEIQEKQEVEDFTEDIAVTEKFEGEDFATDTADITEDFAGDINIGNINEEDLEDF